MLLRGDVLWAGLGARVLALDARDRDHFPVLGSSPVLGGTVRGLAMAGDLALVTGGSELSMLDVSVPTKPRIIATLPLSATLGNVAVYGGFAYVVAGVAVPRQPALSGEVAVVDIHAPDAPRRVGTARLPDHELPADVAVVGDVLAVATSLRGDTGRELEDPAAVQLFDLSQPTLPRLVAEHRDPAWRRLAVGEVPGIGELLFGHGAGGLALRVSDPATPSIVRQYGTPAHESMTVSGLVVAGGRPVVVRPGGFGGGQIFAPGLRNGQSEVGVEYLGQLSSRPAGGIAVVGDRVVAAGIGGRLEVFGATGDDQSTMPLTQVDTLGTVDSLAVAPEDRDILYASVDEGGLATLRRRPDPLAPRLTVVAWDEGYHRGLGVGAGVATIGYGGSGDVAADDCRAYDVHDPAQPRLAWRQRGFCYRTGLAQQGGLLAAGGNQLGDNHWVKLVDLTDLSVAQELAKIPVRGPFSQLVLADQTLSLLHFDGGQTYAPLPPLRLATFDISNPTAPVRVADAVVGLAQTFTGDPVILAEAGDTAIALYTEKLTATEERPYLAMLDTSNRASPSILTRLPLSAPYGDIAIAWGHAFITLADGVLVLDIREPALPRVLGKLAGVPSLAPNSIVVIGGLLYVASGLAGVLVYRPDLPWPPEAGAATPTATLAAATPNATATPWPTLTPVPPPDPIWLPLTLR